MEEEGKTDSFFFPGRDLWEMISRQLFSKMAVLSPNSFGVTFFVSLKMDGGAGKEKDEEWERRRRMEKDGEGGRRGGDGGTCQFP
jgi:hypothetical protein